MTHLTFCSILRYAVLVIFAVYADISYFDNFLSKEALPWNQSLSECKCGILLPSRSSYTLLRRLLIDNNKSSTWINLRWIIGMAASGNVYSERPLEDRGRSHNACVYTQEGHIYASDCQRSRGVICQKVGNSKLSCENSPASFATAKRLCDIQHAHLQAPETSSFTIPDACKEKGYPGYWTSGRFVNNSFAYTKAQGWIEVDKGEYNCSFPGNTTIIESCGLLTIEEGKIYCSFVPCKEKHALLCNNCRKDKADNPPIFVYTTYALASFVGIILLSMIALALVAVSRKMRNSRPGERRLCTLSQPPRYSDVVSAPITLSHTASSSSVLPTSGRPHDAVYFDLEDGYYDVPEEEYKSSNKYPKTYGVMNGVIVIKKNTPCDAGMPDDNAQDDYYDDFSD